jgi:hypothetical protein
MLVATIGLYLGSIVIVFIGSNLNVYLSTLSVLLDISHVLNRWETRRNSLNHRGQSVKTRSHIEFYIETDSICSICNKLSMQ